MLRIEIRCGRVTVDGREMAVTSGQPVMLEIPSEPLIPEIVEPLTEYVRANYEDKILQEALLQRLFDEISRMHVLDSIRFKDM